MPIYEFRCTSCGYQWETLVSTSSDNPVECPGCRGKEIKRLVSAAHFSRLAPRPAGKTCCGRSERCDTPPCEGGDRCGR
ncbi:MAG: zinc ribbon domain-containing protein [Firmicutes bacterium]|nr:zinc ribbon domain-containing protein [Bacillota bacterium]